MDELPEGTPTSEEIESPTSLLTNIHSSKDVDSLSEPQLKFILMKSGRQVALKKRMTKKEMVSIVKEMWCQLHNVDPNSEQSGPEISSKSANNEKPVMRRTANQDLKNSNVHKPTSQLRFKSVPPPTTTTGDDVTNKQKARRPHSMIEHSIGNKYTSVMDTLMEHFNKTMGPDGQSTSVTSKDHETPDVSRQVVDDHVTDFDDDQKRSGKNRDQENDLTDSTHVRRPQPKPRRSKLVSNSTVDGAVIQPKARPRSMIGQDIENKYTSVMGTLMGHFNKTSDTDDQSAKGPPRDCETPNLPHQADARHSDAEDCDRTVTNKAGESDCREAGLEFEAKEVHCLGDIESLQLIPKLTIRQMKSVLQEKGVNTSSLFERSEYEKEVIKLWTNRVTDIE